MKHFLSISFLLIALTAVFTGCSQDAGDPLFIAVSPDTTAVLNSGQKQQYRMLFYARDNQAVKSLTITSEDKNNSVVTHFDTLFAATPTTGLSWTFVANDSYDGSVVLKFLATDVLGNTCQIKRNVTVKNTVKYELSDELKSDSMSVDSGLVVDAVGKKLVRALTSASDIKLLVVSSTLGMTSQKYYFVKTATDYTKITAATARTEFSSSSVKQNMVNIALNDVYIFGTVSGTTSDATGIMKILSVNNNKITVGVRLVTAK